MSIAANSLKRVNPAIAWKRIVALTKMGDPSGPRLLSYMVASTATWPALAFLGWYTMKMDLVEHHYRAQYVNKKLPWMNNPSDIAFGWGTPCTIFNFECYYEHRKTINPPTEEH